MMARYLKLIIESNYFYQQLLHILEKCPKVYDEVWGGGDQSIETIDRVPQKVLSWAKTSQQIQRRTSI